MGSIALVSKQMTLARQYLDVAIAKCPTDPAVWLEAGLLESNEGNYDVAWSRLSVAVDLINTSSVSRKLKRPLSETFKSWERLVVTLGHVARKRNDLASALFWFDLAKLVSPERSSTLCALGIVHHLMGNLEEAILYYHSSIAINPEDSLAQQLLSFAIDQDTKHSEQVNVNEIKSIADNLVIGQGMEESQWVKVMSATSKSVFKNGNRSGRMNNGMEDMDEDGADDAEDAARWARQVAEARNL
jgi:anaphase-promoting complex subunit 6